MTNNLPELPLLKGDKNPDFSGFVGTSKYWGNELKKDCDPNYVEPKKQSYWGAMKMRDGVGKKFLFLGLVISTCSGLLLAQSQNKREQWKSITPLVSHLREVETLLGSPTKIDGRSRYYDTAAGERVTIWYSGPPDNSSCKWIVPDDTVLRVIVSPRKRLLVSQVGYDLSKFEKRATLDDEVWNYVDEKRGILIEIRQYDDSAPTVIFLELAPTTKDKKERCLASQSPERKNVY